MSDSHGLPNTLQEAIRYSADPQRCLDFAIAMRWPHGPVCPMCTSNEHRFIKKRCKKQYTVKLGTIFEDSPINGCVRFGWDDCERQEWRLKL